MLRICYLWFQESITTILTLMVSVRLVQTILPKFFFRKTSRNLKRKGDLSPLYRIIMSLYGVIGYHVTLSEGHMIANHPI